MKVRIKDIISPKRWLSVFVWLLKKLVRKLDNSEVQLEAWEIEQYMFRILRCPDCVENKTCVHCGCDTMGRMMNRFDSCSQNKWGKFFESEKEWKDYKDSKDIYFSLLTSFTDKREIQNIIKLITLKYLNNESRK